VGVDDRVVFTGDCADVVTLLHAADAFVLASESEGLPLAVLEAMAAGVPLISYELPCLSRELVDGVSARLVAIGDSEALAAAVRELLADKDLRDSLAAEAGRLVAARFDSRVMSRRVVCVYDEVLGATGTVSHEYTADVAR
jgi:glycosyltransferase involved in cell wall biosynthesis